MRNVMTIMKKELRRFFTDKRLLVSLILPGVLIFVLYSLMGRLFGSMVNTDADHVYGIYVVNAPSDFGDTVASLGIKYEITSPESDEKALEDVKKGDADIFVRYEEDFEGKVSRGEKPGVEIYRCTTNAPSANLYEALYAAIYRSSVSVETIFTVNAGDKTYDLATKEDISAMIITMILPFLLNMLLFAGCMAVATESIAGEKERGTIATLLVTPVKRSHIAIGKIAALSITALCSSIVTFIGLIASLPQLTQGAGTIDVGMYGPATYLAVFAVIIVTVLMFTVILSVVSALAGSVKEATQYALPAMMIVMLAGLGSMIGGGPNENLWTYFIPIYNSTQCVSALFAMKFSAVNFAVTVATDAVFVTLGVFLLAKIFNSEKIMFGK